MTFPIPLTRGNSSSYLKSANIRPFRMKGTGVTWRAFVTRIGDCGARAQARGDHFTLEIGSCLQIGPGCSMPLITLQ